MGVLSPYPDCSHQPILKPRALRTAQKSRNIPRKHRAAQGSSGEPRRAQHSQEELRTAQEASEELRTPQESLEQLRGDIRELRAAQEAQESFEQPRRTQENPKSPRRAQTSRGELSTRTSRSARRFLIAAPTHSWPLLKELKDSRLFF